MRRLLYSGTFFSLLRYNGGAQAEFTKISYLKASIHLLKRRSNEHTKLSIKLLFLSFFNPIALTLKEYRNAVPS